jgi:hypothetical protein
MGSIKTNFMIDYVGFIVMSIESDEFNYDTLPAKQFYKYDKDFKYN